MADWRERLKVKTRLLRCVINDKEIGFPLGLDLTDGRKSKDTQIGYLP